MWGVADSGFFPGGLSKIGELLINNYQLFYCYRCFKTSIIVCIDHLLSTVG